MEGITIADIEVGRTASFTKTISESDVYLYAGISGDNNPAHIDQVSAEAGMFKGRIAHGMFTASFISTVLGTRLPGPGTIYLGQDLKFRRPVYFGDTLTARCTAVEVDSERNRVVFETVVTNQNGVDVVTGQATVMPPAAA